MHMIWSKWRRPRVVREPAPVRLADGDTVLFPGYPRFADMILRQSPTPGSAPPVGRLAELGSSEPQLFALPELVVRCRGRLPVDRYCRRVWWHLGECE